MMPPAPHDYQRHHPYQVHQASSSQDESLPRRQHRAASPAASIHRRRAASPAVSTRLTTSTASPLSRARPAGDRSRGSSPAPAFPSPSPTASPATSCGSSSFNHSGGFQRAGSASSSLGTSPLTHADAQTAATQHNLASIAAGSASPRTRTIIQAQRAESQQLKDNAAPHMYAGAAHSLPPQHPIAGPSSTPATRDGQSTSSTTVADVHMTSPSPPAERTEGGTGADRGTKARRASSGGSRIPERGRAYSNTSSAGSSGSNSNRAAAATAAAPPVPPPAQRTLSGSSSASSNQQQQLRQHHQSRQASQHEQHSPQATRRSPMPDSPRPPPSSSSASMAAGQTHSGSAPSSSASSSTAPRATPLPRLDLANYPQQDLLRILAALLHQISTANDTLRPSPSTPAPAPSSSSTSLSDYDASTVTTPDVSLADRRSSVTTAAMGALGTPSSTLCFHARNVPSISIESYLLRILKYCPTTNDVFLSLLVYFDRMSRMAVGSKPRQHGRESSLAGADAGLPQAQRLQQQQQQQQRQQERRSTDTANGGLTDEDDSTTGDAHPGMKGFAIDSFNVHRLVIAGVTVASKFFSDVFYTNSRYAKVGGLPVHELNQLELQFLLLNDFHLMITMDEIQRYADQLLAYSQGGGPETIAAAIASGSGPGSGSSPSSRTDIHHQAHQHHQHRPDRSAAAAVRGMHE